MMHRKYNTRSSYCAAISRARAPSIRRTLRLSTISKKTPESILSPEKRCRSYEIPSYTAHVDRRSTARETHLELEFVDERSTTLPFQDIRRSYPHLARAIDDLAPCAPGVSFYVLENLNKTIAIPTSKHSTSLLRPSMPRTTSSKERRVAFVLRRQASFQWPWLCRSCRRMRPREERSGNR